MVNLREKIAMSKAEAVPLPSEGLTIQTPAICTNCRFWTTYHKRNPPSIDDPEGQPYDTQDCKYGLTPGLWRQRKYRSRNGYRYERVLDNFCVAWQPQEPPEPGSNPFDS